MYSFPTQNPPAARKNRIPSYTLAGGRKGRLAQDLLDVLGKMAEGVFAVDSDYRIIFWNEVAQHMLGYSPEEILGKRCCDVLAGLDQYDSSYCQKNCSPMTLTRIGQPVGTVDVLARTKSGKRLWINLSTLPIPSKGRESFAMVHIFRDHSAQQLIEDYVRARGARFGEFLPGGCSGGQAEKLRALTKRECEILQLLASGSSTERIAESLGITRTTARNHVQNTLSKLGAHSRLEAVAIANRHDLLHV